MTASSVAAMDGLVGLGDAPHEEAMFRELGGTTAAATDARVALLQRGIQKLAEVSTVAKSSGSSKSTTSEV